MIFYAGRGVDCRPAIAADMRPPVDDKDGNAGLVGDALRHRGTEQAGADNDDPILTQRRANSRTPPKARPTELIRGEGRFSEKITPNGKANVIRSN